MEQTDYYRLYSDMYYPKRWYLGDINVDDDWIFMKGIPVNEKEFKDLKVEVYEKGEERDFTETDPFAAPIVSEDFAEWLYEYMNEVQLLPVKVPRSKKKYFILVVKNRIDCVDESRSEFEKYEEGNDIRPDLAGEYSSIAALKIKPEVVDKAIFRIDKYEVVIVINGDLKRKLEKAKLTGVVFESVT